MRVRPRVRGVSERVPGLWSRDRTLRRKATGQESAHGASGMPTLPSDGARLAAEAAAFLADQVPDAGSEAPRGGSNYRLLLPYTQSQPAERALEAAVDLSSLFSAEVWVLHVREWDEFGGGRSYLETRGEAVALVGGAVEQLRQHGLTARAVVKDSARGRVPHEIAVKADELRADAIVVGARQRSLLSAALFGSVSLGVMRRANCPVIVVHTPAR
jgi:nucleotide-binding universal stress UspA family protein